MKSPASLSLAALLVLAGCAGGDRLAPAPAADDTISQLSDTPVKLGAPYQVGSTTYMPEDPGSYDEVGYASVYGSELAGKPTARGEAFDPAAITAAHKTLPLPSYVEVTALETGRTILVRVNDRGPFSNDRLIDLSEGAARQLGIAGQGSVGVRVRRVSPIEQERSLLRGGQPAAVRIDTPEMLLRVLRDKLAKLPQATPQKPTVAAARAPERPAKAIKPPKPAKPGMSSKPAEPVLPVVTAADTSPDEDRFIVEQFPEGSRIRSETPAPLHPAKPVAAPATVYVQVAAFASRAKADALAKRIGARVLPSSNGKIFRVRYGPYANAAEARAGVASARRNGYSGTITRD